MINRYALVPIFILAAVLRLSAEGPPLAHVKITQKHLTLLCLNQQRVKESQRSLDLPLSEQTLTFTMKNQPRTGVTNSGDDPGVAVIHFTPENGHRYEIETRGHVESYSTRVWRKKEWKPVVRDRTTGQIVSSDPEWVDTDCRK
jgi:hypothetical protein